MNLWPFLFKQHSFPSEEKNLRSYCHSLVILQSQCKRESAKDRINIKSTNIRGKNRCLTRCSDFWSKKACWMYNKVATGWLWTLYFWFICNVSNKNTFLIFWIWISKCWQNRLINKRLNNRKKDFPQRASIPLPLVLQWTELQSIN